VEKKTHRLGWLWGALCGTIFVFLCGFPFFIATFKERSGSWLRYVLLACVVVVVMCAGAAAGNLIVDGDKTTDPLALRFGRVLIWMLVIAVCSVCAWYISLFM
jgi:hypothetical protein